MCFLNSSLCSAQCRTVEMLANALHGLIDRKSSLHCDHCLSYFMGLFIFSMLSYIKLIPLERKKSSHVLRELLHGLPHLETFGLNLSSSSFVIRVNHSILNHPCSFMVYYYLFGVFLS